MTKKHPPALRLIAAAAAAALPAATARGQLVYEPFDYPAGSGLGGKVNPISGLAWSPMSNNGADDDVTITSGSLSYPGLAPASGNSASYAGGGKSERLSLGDSFSGGTFYYSMTFRVTAAGAMTTSPVFVAGFSDLSGPSGAQPQTVGTRLYLKQGSSPTTFNIGVSKNSNTAGDILFDATEYTFDTPVLVVGSYKINGTSIGTDDEAKLYINPDASTFGADAPPVATPGAAPVITAPLAGTDMNVGGTPSVAGFVLRQGNAQVPAIQVDELRVDRSWAQVTPTAGIAWNVNGDGNWSEGAKWTGGAAPNAGTAIANFNGIIQQARTVTLDVPAAVRTINFNASHRYTLAGEQPIEFSAGGAVNVIGGSHTISAPITLGGDWLANVRTGSTLSVTGTVNASGRNVAKSGGGTLEVNRVRAASLHAVGGTVKVMPSGGTGAVSRISAFDYGENGRLDLTDNAMVVDYASTSPLGTWNGSGYTGINGALHSGRNGGSWDGPGLITSQSHADTGLTALVALEASQALQLSNGQTATWRGQSVDATTVLVRYTYGGDADLSGALDSDDYFAIDSNFNLSGSVFGYNKGDFDLNGTIDSDDYFIIDSNWNNQILGEFPGAAAGDASPISAVPEPAAATLAAAAALLLGRRRRRA